MNKRRMLIPALVMVLTLVAAACGDGETAGEPAVEVTTYDGDDSTDSGDQGADEDVGEPGAADEGDDGPEAATDESTDGGSPATAPQDPDEGTAEGALAVRVACPDSFLLNEKTVCEIISTGAVSGQWRLPGLLDGPLELENVPGSNAIFIEPTNAAYVGAWFTLTAEVTGPDGAVATDTLNFTVESSGEAASLLDGLNGVTAATPVNFATGSSAIEPAGAATLTAVLELLLASPDVRVEVGGHTDDVGADDANQALSLARAKAVVDYFVANGVPAGQVIPAGYGPTQPVADNGTEEGRAKNRRIEFREVGDGPFISIDCPTEFTIGVETRCNIVTANATQGTWRVDGFTNGDVVLATIPGTNQIFLQPNNPDFAGERFVIAVSVTDSAGLLATANHEFTLVLE